MYVTSDSKRYRCQACKSKVSGEDLEAIFLEQLQGILISPDSVAEHLAEVDEEIRKREERLAALEAEATRTRADMAKLFRLYTGDHISPAGFEERNRPLEERVRAIGEEVMKELHVLDQVAYVRFASVYREFKDINQFMDELKGLLKEEKPPVK